MPSTWPRSGTSSRRTYPPRSTGSATDDRQLRGQVPRPRPTRDVESIGPRRRPRDVIALHEVGAERAQCEVLRRRLDAFRDDAQAEAAGELQDRRDDGECIGILRYAGDERLVDLQVVDGERAQVRERRVADPEVV